jgi:hemerythrin-like domain-containing protein
MAVVRKREPRLERVINELANEHGQLLSALDALLAESASIPSLDEAMRAKVCQWINHVRQHEGREDHLVQDAFNLDMGTEETSA